MHSQIYSNSSRIVNKQTKAIMMNNMIRRWKMMENYLMMKVLNLYLNNSMLSEDAKSQINQG